MRGPQSAPLRYLLLVTGCWLTVFLLTRCALLFGHLAEAGSGGLMTFPIGLIYDLVFLAYTGVPLGLYLLLFRQRCGVGVHIAG